MPRLVSTDLLSWPTCSQSSFMYVTSMLTRASTGSPLGVSVTRITPKGSVGLKAELSGISWMFSGVAATVRSSVVFCS